MTQQRHTEGCLICGKELTYVETPQNAYCYFCGKIAQTHAFCKDGHYVCDSCHAEEGLVLITSYATKTQDRDPLSIATEIMRDPSIKMHGPEHHYLVGAALLAAYRNAGGTVDFDKALQDILQRATEIPGGVCGIWGSCGAGIGTGIFISVITGASPLSLNEWSLANQMTSESLAVIARNGGPRCCKRNTYIAIGEAAGFLKEHFDVSLELPEHTACEFYQRNKQCRATDCPFFPSETVY